MRKRFYSLGVFLFILPGLFVETNFACFGGPSSDRITNLKQYNLFVRDFNRAAAVFSGKVVELDRFKVKFRIDKIWKGELPNEFVMSTGMLPTDRSDIVMTSTCDYEFQLGKSYIVYARKNPFFTVDDPFKNFFPSVPEEYRILLYTSQGSRTKPLEKAKLGIENLNELVKPTILKPKTEIRKSVSSR